RTGPQQRRSVNMNGLVGQRAGYAELSPGADVLRARARRAGVPSQGVPATAAFGTENAIEFFDRELCQGIVLVHQDRVRRRLVRSLEAAGGHFDLDRVDPRALVRPVALIGIN